MGKCIKCGKETANSYTYYSGEEAGRFSSQSGNTVTTQINYKNLQTHSDYLCSRCGVFSSAVGFTVGAFCCLAFAVFLVTIAVRGNASTWIGVAMFGLFGGGMLPASVISFRDAKADRRLTGDDGAKKIINISYKQKRHPGKRLFNPTEIQKLR